MSFSSNYNTFKSMTFPEYYTIIIPMLLWNEISQFQRTAMNVAVCSKWQFYFVILDVTRWRIITLISLKNDWYDSSILQLVQFFLSWQRHVYLEKYIFILKKTFLSWKIHFLLEKDIFILKKTFFDVLQKIVIILYS